MTDTAAATGAPPAPEKRRPANTWIVSSYRFQQHHSLKAAEVEAGRLQSRFPAKSFTIYRVKSTLEPSTSRDLHEARAALAYIHRHGCQSYVDLPEEHQAAMMVAVYNQPAATAPAEES